MRILGPISRKAYALAIGVFDGVHLGHQVLIKRLLQLAEGKPAGLLTFDPHPQEVVRGEPMPLITDKSERLQLLKALGIKTVYTIPFDRSIQKMAPEAFVKNLMKQLSPKKVVVGYDFMFGQGREGNAGYLALLGKKYGFDVYIEPPVRKQNIAISSSLIRKYIQAGKVSLVAKLLGRYYSISGKVLKGSGRGEKLSFPTANLSVSPKKCHPAYGVYAAVVNENKRESVLADAEPAVCNFGVRPTFGARSKPLLEVHFFSKPPELRGKTLTVQFVARLRSEKKFKNAEALAAQIKKDKERAYQRLRKACQIA